MHYNYVVQNYINVIFSIYFFITFNMLQAGMVLAISMYDYHGFIT